MSYEYELKREGGGAYTQGEAGETLGERNLVYLNNSGQWVKADASAIAQMPIVGMTIGAIPTGKRGKIFLQGFIGYQSWSWTTGSDVYAGATPGDVVQTTASHSSTQRIGVAVNSDLIYFNPGDLLLDSLPFQVTAGGAGAGIVAGNFVHADASPKGWSITGANEWVIIYGYLPTTVRQVLRVRVQAVALGAPGAGNGMLIDLLMNSAGFGEQFDSENISVAGKRTRETGFAVDDVISWEFTSTDDSDINDLAAQDEFEIKIKYSAAAGSDIATNAVFRSVEVDYI